MAVTVSSNNRISFPDQAWDRNPTPGQKWFSLQDNKLDGSYHTMPGAETNQALNKTVTIGAGTVETSSSSKSIGLITDGDITSSNYYGLSAGPSNMIVDLGQILGIDSLTIWHYYADDRTYHGTKTEVSNDGQNWDVVFDSAVSGEYVETSSGHTITTSGKSFRYIRDWLNGSTANTSNHWVEIEANSAPEVGWWGNVLSDANGAFSTAETLTQDFGGQTQSVQTMRVQGDALLNEYPVDFTITLYNGATVLYEEHVTGNTNVAWSKQTPRAYDVTKIVLGITKINKANRTVKVTEASQLFQFTRSDTVTITSSATTTAGIGISSSDTITIVGSESSDPVKAIITRTDTLTITSSENKGIQALVSSSDALVIAQDEVNSLTNELSSSDTLAIRKDVENEDVIVSFTSTDALTILADADKSSMTNIHTVMDGSYRKIYGKVEVTFTDLFLKEKFTTDSSSVAYPTAAIDVTDGVSDIPYKSFSLLDNKLDGTYHPLPDNPTSWWGTVLSDASGVLPTPEWLKIIFDAARPVYRLRAFGDDIAGNYPVDFTVKLYDASDTLLYTETVTGNTNPKWEKYISDPITNVVIIELNITKISKPYDAARISEMYALIQKTYMDDNLVALDLLEEQVFDDMTLPIGNISSNEIDISLLNVDRELSPGNKNSNLYGYLKKNRRIVPWLGAEVVPGEIEWYQLGVYWSQDWKSPADSVSASTTGLDRLELLRNTDYVTSPVWQDTDLYTIAEAILVDAGLDSTEYVIDEALRNIIHKYVWFERGSHRDALQQIAIACLGRVYCDRLGRINIVVFTPEPYYMKEMDADKDILSADRPLAWTQIYNYIEVSCTPRIVDVAQEIYSSTDVIVMDPGTTYTETIEFNSVPVIDLQQPVLTGATNTTVTATYYAYGAILTFQNNGSTTETITNVSITGAPVNAIGKKIAIAKDDQSILENGKASYTYDCAFLQDYSKAQDIASQLLSTYMDPRHDLTLDTRGDISLQLGDRITTKVTNEDGTYEDFFITRQKLKWAGFLEASIDAQRIGG